MPLFSDPAGSQGGCRRGSGEGKEDGEERGHERGKRAVRVGRRDSKQGSGIEAWLLKHGLDSSRSLDSRPGRKARKVGENVGRIARRKAMTFARRDAKREPRH